MLNVALPGNIQIKPPDNYAGRRATDLSFDKAENVSRLAAKDAAKDAVREQVRDREAGSLSTPLAAASDIDARSETRLVEKFPSVLEEMSAQVALEFKRPLTEVRTPPMPYREFLDLLYKQPEYEPPALSAGNTAADGLSVFMPLDMKV